MSLSSPFDSGRRRIGAVLSLIVSLAVPAAEAAQQQAVLVNDGKPVQVRISKPMADRVHAREIEEIRSAPAREGAVKGVADPMLYLPIRPGFGNDNPGFMAISNFVDHDSAFPDMLLDYDCGDRTYDTESDNHNGTDFQSSMFTWLTMHNEGLIAVAAADGTIIEKHDGESDMNCAFGNPVSNRVWLEHDNGSVTIYAHCKTGTLTPRQVGDFVEAGDYLCVVGSSGQSTGPHLHLSVQNPALDLQDPYAGACNSLNSQSWWADQEPYEVKTINLVATHTQPPEYPPCPQTEIPHFEDQFVPGDTVYMSAFVRDFAGGEDSLDVEVRDPTGAPVIQTSFEDPNIGFAAALSVVFGVEFSEAAGAGAWTLAITYNAGAVSRAQGAGAAKGVGDNTLEHTFYLNSGPDPLPQAVPENNAYNGLYFDAGKDGEGYNFVTADGGTIVYFYGSDSKGNRLWLISDLFYGPITDGQEVVINMYESTGGVFSTPVSSARGLSYWGTVTIVFTDCESGIATLSGIDGHKVSQIIKLAGVAGTNCTSGGVPSDAGMSGLHFDTGKDGEGYNLIVAPNGSILYFYGFKSNGLRLWLISDLITEVLAVGVDVVTPVFEATQGTFDSPVPSSEALVEWGTATIRVNGCDSITITLQGQDGTKISNTIRLAGIIGLTCSDS